MLRKIAVFVGLATLVACGDGGSSDDAGPDVVVVSDGAAETGSDATVDASDAGDASDGAVDVTSDVAPDVFDSGLTNPTSIQIFDVKQAATSPDAGALSMPINDAIVTYVTTAIGNDPAGFFVEAEQTGPAIFVAVDPQTLSPVPVPGDQVSFTVTSAAVVTGVHEVLSLTGFTRTAQNVSLAALLRDVGSATDLVTNINAYESEYVTLVANVKTSFAASGPSFVAAQIETTGLTGNAALNLRLRTPQATKTALAVDVNCSVTLTGVMWRFGGVAMPAGWLTADFASLACAPPKVKSALATSDNSVVVTFDRDLNGATLASDGSQFTFDQGLTSSAAAQSATNQITVTTSTQAQNTTYKVTAASTLQDVLGKGIDTNANSASFSSYSSTGTLQLNEINPNITSSLDLVELLALTSGTINGITLEQDIGTKTVLATMPNITVTKGDLVVVHLGATTATSETSTQTDCTDASCYAGAWDVKGGSSGVTYSGRVIVVRSPNNGSIQDTAPFYTATPPSGFYSDVMSIQSAGFWLPADCNGNPCNTNTLAETVSVVWTGCGTSATGNSVARKANADTNYATDWAVGTSSFGSTNP
jgi:hypothetical protein